MIPFNRTSTPFLLFFSMLLTTSLQAREVVVQEMDVVKNNAEIAMGQDSSSDSTLTDAELFGVEGGGYFHPYLSLGGEYTDNLYNMNIDEKDNFLTTITPGFWISLPGRKQVPLQIAPNNTSAGGLQYSPDDYTSFDRMNIYLLGEFAYKTYSEDSNLNDYDARLEGLFKYNLRGGLSVEFIDRFTRSQDRFDLGASTAEDLRRYYSNIFIADADWDISEKFSTKLEYSNFYLDYKEQGDEFLNRTDNSFSLYGSYNYSVKTALFLEYRFVDVSYDVRQLTDSKYNYFLGGIGWTSTEKTAFRFKTGYQERKFKNDTVDNLVEASKDADNDTFFFELALNYQFTEKTKFILKLSHDIEETDSRNSLDQKILAGNFRYEQYFNENFIGTCDFRYERADYTQIIGPDRDEDRYLIRPALQYFFKDWLMAELSYGYETRDSSDSLFDYSTNTVSFSLNSAL